MTTVVQRGRWLRSGVPSSGWAAAGLAAGLAAGVWLMASGCSGGGSHPSSTGDPLLDVQNTELPMSRRVKSIDEAWAEAQAGRYERDLTRKALAEEIVWDRSSHPNLRLTAMRVLVSDETPGGAEFAQDLCAALLPTEDNRDIVELVSETSARRGWTGLKPSLVRALATPVPRVEDLDRPEAAALRSLGGGQPLNNVVFDVFVEPLNDVELGGQRAERVATIRREAAWDLLARLDPTGGQRMDLVRARLASGSDEPALAAVVATTDTFGVIPVTGDELSWAVSLHDGSNASNQAWWRETSAAVARLSPQARAGLRMRHLEAIRWTAQHEPSRLSKTLAELISEASARVAGRSVYQRSADSGMFGRNPSERLDRNARGLVWGDALALLAVDDALQDPGVRASLYGQAESDRADETTEYGGALELIGAGREYIAAPYLPRPMQREHDRKYVPPVELVRQTERALAHYHFHVQDLRNEAFAGPGEGDLIYAARSGRTCLVLTSVDRDGTLNVDYFQPNGLIVDLGLIARP